MMCSARDCVRFLQSKYRCAGVQSYTNYTKSPSAVSVITMDGCTYTGAFIESAAFNPSLAPFQGAWAAAVMDKVSGFDQVGAQFR